MGPVSIGPITGGLKPKYKLISTLMGGDDLNPMKNMDVFIDLNTLVSSLSTWKKYQSSLPFGQDIEKDIIYGILMILKHWKGFTNKWENTRIFLMVNDFEMVMPAEREYMKSYLSPFVNKFESDRYKQFVYYWNESIKRVEIILKYIPNSYLIKCNRFDSYVLPNIIDDYENNGRNRIIISGSNLMTNYMFYPNTTMIFTKYHKNGMRQISDPNMIVQDISGINENIMDIFATNKVFFNLLNAIVGDFDRCIIGLSNVGITTFAVNLLRAVEKHEIPDTPSSIESVLPVINSNFHDYLRKNYPLIDLETHSKMVPQSMIEKVKSEMIDLYDVDGLRSISVDGLNLLELL